MTALDDALNSSARVFTPADLVADWAEQVPSENTDGNLDSPRVLSDQMTGEFKVEHSLDDGLPSPVTMTNSNDASGVLTATLNGRDGIWADVIGWRTPVGGVVASTTALTTTAPTDILPGDYAIVAISMNSSATTLTFNAPANEENEPWILLADISDGAGLRTVVFGGRWYGSRVALTGVSSSAVAYSWTCSAAYARTARGDYVKIRAGVATSLAEVSSVTAHVATPATLTKRGYMVGVWSLVAASATWSTTDTELDERASVIDLMMSRSTSLLYPDTYTLTGTSSGATAVATKTAIPLEIVDRPRMDAMSYFSPFNVDSPVYRRDRDTAETQLDFNVLTATGPVGTTLHKGQMADIGVKGRQGELSAISKTRLDLAKSLTLPVVWGNRENCTIDWFATWIMARGGQFVGPAPTSYNVYWAPMYGSAHAHYETPYGYNSGVYYDSTGGPFGLRPPSAIEGPFLTAMYGKQDDDRAEEVRVTPIKIETRDLSLTSATDLMSAANSKGRLYFWVRGDAVTAAPSYTGDPLMARYQMYQKDSGGGIDCGVWVEMRSSDRKISVAIGGASTSFTHVIFTSAGTIPTDGLWHFVGIAWDWIGMSVKVRIDGTESSSTFWNSGTTYINPVDLPATDAANVAAGGSLYIVGQFRIPVSDLHHEVRPYTDTFAHVYPTLQDPSANAVMRATNQSLEVIADPVPIIGWDSIVDLAQSSLSAYRTNETDNLEFLPQSYFGETAQMTSTQIFDTEVNTSDLDVKQDPSKARNVVTVQFKETRTDNTTSPILNISASIAIPRGVSTVTFPLDTLTAEIHGASVPGAAWWTLTNLTASQISTPSIPGGVHFMSANSAADGTGTVLAASSVTAKILYGDASTITLQFTNKTTKVAYLANNGTEVPFLRLLGYAVKTADGYVTQRDAGSIGTRRERALDVELPWIQNRDVATSICQLLVTALARPRPEVSVQVAGDPRRTPGQLVTMADSVGTQAAGTWRILSIGHEVDGPKYVQNLALVQVLPIGVWDGPDGWDLTLWAE